MDMRFSLEVELMKINYGLGMKGWPPKKGGNKDDFQVPGISSRVIGAIYQWEMPGGGGDVGDQVWGVESSFNLGYVVWDTYQIATKQAITYVKLNTDSHTIDKFRIVAVTNYPKLNGLKQHSCVWNGCHRAKIKVAV